MSGPARVGRESIFAGATPASWIALAILIAVGLYMYADRNVVTLQTEPIRHALGLSDLQIGLVQGLSVALFAAVAAYPIAWVADRFDVRFILSACILVWCTAVAACGLAGDFQQLFIASAIVGVGEAALLPITYTLIPILFEGRARLLANSMVTVIGRIASGIVIAASGWLVESVDEFRPLLPAWTANFEDWRVAFFLLAVPGPIFAFLILLLRIPRTMSALPGEMPAKDKKASILPFLRKSFPTLALTYSGVGLLVFGMSAIGAFLPVVAIRQMGATPGDVGTQMGAATLIATVIAMAIIVSIGGKLASRLGPRYTVWLLSVASLVPALLSPAFLLADTPRQLFLLLGLIFVFLGAGAMAFPTALQDLTPRPTRARLISIAILINIILSALAPAVVGAVSDQLKYLPNGLMVAVAATSFISLSLSAVLLAAAGRRYVATMQAARDEEREAES